MLQPARNQPHSELSRRSFRILSLDGGGIRGLITARWQHRLEQELGDQPLREHFDLVAGTSTGGILACAIAAGMRAADIERVYRQRGREVFPGVAARAWNRLQRTFTQGLSAPKFSDEGLGRVLRDQFGDRTLGSLPPRPLLLVTTYNTLTRQSLVIKNNRPRYAGIHLWELAKASSSAPTYFPAHVMEIDGVRSSLIDGGVVANNPAACAIAEGIRVLRDQGEPASLARLLVASFGTGTLIRPITAEQAREWGPLEWAVPVIDVLMDGAADATDYMAEQLVPTEQYFRFQTRLSDAYDDMDDASDENLDALLNVAEHHLSSEGGRARIRALAERLASQQPG